MASAPIGEIPVLITGDWSDLQVAINQAVQMAEAGAQEIAAAFQFGDVGGMTGAFGAATDSLGQFSEGAAGVGGQLTALEDSFSSLGGIDLSGTFDGADQSITDLDSSLQAAEPDLEAFASSLEALASIDVGDGISEATGELQGFGVEVGDVVTDADDLATAFDQFASTDVSGLEDANEAINELASSLPDVAGEADSAGAAADQAGSDIGDLGTDAILAAAGIAEVPPALEEVGESAHEAESGLAGTVEKLIELGEALVITEALKEFAEEALEVYGNVQKASISLTALTGSAENADAIIEKLKNVATSDALSFEPLVGAAQKMTALGFSTDQVYKALQTAADAAAATGSSFDRVTQSIERMALSGTAGARQLATLGISVDTLGTIMGVAAAQVTTAFKALDQTQRLDVLEEALSKFGGLSQQVAQGILGQWQNFKTQFEFVMESVGASLAPVAADFLAFVNSDILPFIKGLAEAFGSLPTPVKDFVVVVGLAAAAVPVLNLGLGALLKLLETFEILNLAEWGTTFVEAATNVAFAVQNDLVAALTTGETMLLRVAQGAGIAAAAFAGWALGTWLYNNIPAVKAFGDAMADWILAIPGLQALIDKMSGVGAAQASLAAATQQLNDKLALTGNEVVPQVGESLDSFSARVRAAAAALGTVQTATQSLTVYQQTLNSLIGKAQEAWGNQTMALVNARTNLEAVTMAYQGGTATLGQYQAAQQAVEAAQLAINPNFVTAKMATAELSTATTALNQSQTTLSTLLKTGTAPAIESVTTAQNNLKSAQASYQASLAALQDAQINLNTAVSMGTAGYKLQGPAVTAVKQAETDAKSAKDALASAQKSLTQAQTAATAVSKEQSTTDSDYATMLTTLAKPAIEGYAVSQAQLTAAQNAYKAAVSNEGVIQDQLNAMVAAGQQGSADYKTVQLALSAAHQQVTADLKALNTTSQDYNATSKDLLAAQKALEASETQLDTLYISQSIPNVQNLAQQLQVLRDAKTQVAADTQAQTDAENALEDAITNMLMGTATLGDVTAATLALDQQRTQTTSDTKDLTNVEAQLTSTFGISKQVLLDVTNVEKNMTISTQNANAAFSALGIQSSQSLQMLADKATTAYNIIASSGTSSANQVRDAEIKALQAQQAAYVAEGTNLTTTQQNTLNTLLAQQSQYTASSISQWSTLASTVSTQIGQLSNTLLTNLFDGTDSFGKASIKALENLAAAFVGDLIKPVTTEIANFIANSLLSLGQTITGTLVPDVQSMGQAFASVFGPVGGAAASGASGAASGAAGATGAAGTAVSTALGSITSVITAISTAISAITGIIGDIQTVHTQNELYAIEQNTDYIKGYMDQTVQLLWRLAGDLEFGDMEKDLNILATWGQKDLDAIRSNTYWSLIQLQQTQATLNKGLNIFGGSATTETDADSLLALDNINNTLQYNVGLNPWWQTAIQNVNNSIVTCAGWLQGISGLLQSGINTAGSTVNASSAGLSALASYIGANFTSFETWMFNALGRTMALPALPSPIAIPSALAGASGTGSGVTLNVNTTVQGSVIGQNGMNQLTTTIANNMVAKLRNSGLKY